MKKLILLTLLAGLSTNVYASEKNFVSVGIGSTKDKFDDEDSINGYSFSAEYGKFIESNEKDISFAVTGEFSYYNAKKTFLYFDEKDEVKIPTLALNGYILFTQNKFVPYVGFGLVASMFGKADVTQLSTGVEANMKSESFNLGYQFKLGGKYYVNNDYSVGLECKFTNIDIDLDKLNGIDYSAKIKNKISTFQFKLSKEF